MLHRGYDGSDRYDRFANQIRQLLQLGGLTILQVTGVILIVRGLALPTVNLPVTALGGGFLTVGTVVEFLTWWKHADLVARRLEELQVENTVVRQERDRYLERVLTLAPKGISS